MTTQLKSQTLTKGYIIAFIGTIIWSSTAVIIRFLTSQRQMPPIVLAFWRDLMVCVIISIVLLVFRRELLRLPRIHIRFMVLYGLLLAVFNTTWTLSVYFNGAAVSTVLAYSSAAFTAVLGWKLLNESLDWVKVLAVSLSLLGCIFVSGANDLAAWRLNPVGIATGLVSGLAFAGYSLMGRHASRVGLPSPTVLVYTFGIAAVFLLLFNLISIPGFSGINDLFWLGSSVSGWLLLFLLAIGPTIGGYGLYTVSLGYLPASVANLVATMEPAFTAVQAYILLAERMTATQIAGSAIILAGVLFLRWQENRKLERLIQVEEKGILEGSHR
jgi:drug/metabolite transporter (DMT)-like permease